MRDFIGLLILLAESLPAAYCYYRLVKPFLECGKRTFRVGAAYFLIFLILHAAPFHFDSLLVHGIGSLAGFFVMCLLEQRSYMQKAFIGVTFFSLRWFTLAIVKILYDMLNRFTEHTAYDLNQHFELYVLVCACYLVLESVFMAAVVFCILKSYSYKNVQMSGKELLIVSTPSFLGILGFKIMWYDRSMFMAETRKNAVFYDIMLLLYYTAAIAAAAAVTVLYQNVKAGQEEKLAHELLAVQIENTQKHIGQVENLYENIRSMKHDMTNHIITLERLYAADKEEAKVYSKELREALLGAAGRINSGNPVTDVILQEMQNKAEQRKIEFKMDFHYPADSNVNAFDISVILNNALQNALEYADASDRSVVSILSYRRNNAYIIEVNNSFTGSLKLEAGNGLPMTSKVKVKGRSEDHVHGYGLVNIRRVAEKYAGDIAIDIKDGMFCLSILLMIEV